MGLLGIAFGLLLLHTLAALIAIADQSLGKSHC
jgi:hypothetical protein